MSPVHNNRFYNTGTMQVVNKPVDKLIEVAMIKLLATPSARFHFVRSAHKHSEIQQLWACGDERIIVEDVIEH